LNEYHHDLQFTEVDTECQPLTSSEPKSLQIETFDRYLTYIYGPAICIADGGGPDFGQMSVSVSRNVRKKVNEDKD